MDINTQCKEWDIVLSDIKSIINYYTLLECLDKFGCMYYFCCHDSDTDTEGQLKTLHYHFVLLFNNRIRGKTIIKYLAESLNVLESAISVRKCYNSVSCIQYLIHKNNLDKFQYNRDSIYTNDTKENLNSILDIVLSNQLMIESSLIDLVKQYNNLELIKIIGINNYNHYRLTIRDIRDSLFKGEDTNDC